MNRILNRIISNIANGYEPQDDFLLKDRFKVYTEI